MSHSARDSDRISILLADVVCVVKAKPFAVLPGSGMSIEVTRADGQKVSIIAYISQGLIQGCFFCPASLKILNMDQRSLPPPTGLLYIDFFSPPLNLISVLEMGAHQPNPFDVVQSSEDYTLTLCVLERTLPNTCLIIHTHFFLVYLQCLFSAILGRDQVYQNILDQGMLLGLPWGSDLITGGRVTNTGASNDANSRAGSEEGSCVPEANN